MKVAGLSLGSAGGVRRVDRGKFPSSSVLRRRGEERGIDDGAFAQAQVFDAQVPVDFIGDRLRERVRLG